MNLFRYLTGAASTFLLAFSAQAHPGHSLGEHGPLHTVTSPYHLSLLALGGAALWLASRLVHRRLPRRVCQLLGITSLVAAGVLWGVRA